MSKDPNHSNSKTDKQELEIQTLKLENLALKDIMTKHLKTIAVMDYILINAGINLDYTKIDEKYNKLQKYLKEI